MEQIDFYRRIWDAALDYAKDYPKLVHNCGRYKLKVGFSRDGDDVKAATGVYDSIRDGATDSANDVVYIGSHIIPSRGAYCGAAILIHEMAHAAIDGGFERAVIQRMRMSEDELMVYNALNGHTAEFFRACTLLGSPGAGSCTNATVQPFARALAPEIGRLVYQLEPRLDNCAPDGVANADWRNFRQADQIKRRIANAVVNRNKGEERNDVLSKET